MFIKSINTEIHPFNFRGYLRAHRRSFFAWIGTLGITFGVCNSFIGELFGFYLDNLKFMFKFWLVPQAFVDASALANICPEIDLLEDDQNRLTEFFMRLDNVQETRNLTAIFEKAGLNILFFNNISLIQFLQICAYNKISSIKIDELYKVADTQLASEKKIRLAAKETAKNFLQKVDEDHLKQEKIEEAMNKALEKEVLVKEKLYIKEKLKKHNSKRYKRLLSEIESALKKFS